LTSKTHPYKAGLGPFAPEVYRLPFPNDYRGPSTEEALAAPERALVTPPAAGLPPAVPDRRPRPEPRGATRRPRARPDHACRSRDGSGNRDRARPGRGRLHRRADRVAGRRPHETRRGRHA